MDRGSLAMKQVKRDPEPPEMGSTRRLAFSFSLPPHFWRSRPLHNAALSRPRTVSLSALSSVAHGRTGTALWTGDAFPGQGNNPPLPPPMWAETTICLDVFRGGRQEGKRGFIHTVNEILDYSKLGASADVSVVFIRTPLPGAKRWIIQDGIIWKIQKLVSELRRPYCAASQQMGSFSIDTRAGPIECEDDPSREAPGIHWDNGLRATGKCIRYDNSAPTWYKTDTDPEHESFCQDDFAEKITGPARSLGGQLKVDFPFVRLACSSAGVSILRGIFTALDSAQHEPSALVILKNLSQAGRCDARDEDDHRTMRIKVSTLDPRQFLASSGICGKPRNAALFLPSGSNKARALIKYQHRRILLTCSRPWYIEGDRFGKRSYNIDVDVTDYGTIGRGV
ncbi:hypothetical protein B0H13DRAFT_1903281 [Mycena leptocephala]|nr:hypothetical protein B0H13DRAFT_1903281 [Mycena leptocephala]